MTKSNAYLIVANGDFLPADLVRDLARDKIIIALGTAADKLRQMDVMPQILLGDFDFDSNFDYEAHTQFWGIQHTIDQLSDEDQAYAGNHGVTIVPRKNQMLTDLMKAILYCDEQSANSITIICATGGARLDHHEAALRSLRVYHKHHRDITLHTAHQTIRFLKDEAITFYGEANDQCAILAFPHASFSSQGLVWDVTDFELNFGYSESISNKMRLPTATIHVKGEALLMLPLYCRLC